MDHHPSPVSVPFREDHRSYTLASYSRRSTTGLIVGSRGTRVARATSVANYHMTRLCETLFAFIVGAKCPVKAAFASALGGTVGTESVEAVVQLVLQASKIRKIHMRYAFQ